MITAVVLPVIRLATTPLLIGIPLVLLVIGIMSEFFLLPQPLPCTLTGLTTTVTLVLHTWIWKESAGTMGTANLISHGFPLENHETSSK
jgi:hypothetical protein